MSGASRGRWPLAATLVGGLLLAAAPWILGPYALLVLSYMLVLGIACLALDLLLGHTGLLSLGHAAYFGAGAYAGAFLYAFTPVTSLEVYLAAGVTAATLLAALVGAVCVTATRIHFTILTLAFAQIVHSLFVSGIVFRPFGGVGQGLFLLGGGGLYIPRFTIAGVELAPAVFPTAFYYVVLAAFAAAVGLVWRIVHSPFGLALHAIRDSATRAAFVGLDVRRYRWRAFVLSGVLTGLAGGLWGQLSRQVTPEQLHWLFSAEIVLATVLGGTGRLAGPLAGAAALTLLQELAVRVTFYRGLVLGALLIAAVLACPGGVAGLLAGRRHRA